ncbi:MAG: NAD(P)/FAD-dependent oxidoreductase [Pirellulales bacterium]
MPLDSDISLRLDNEIKCEVAIVGGGVSGALAAYFLLREGVDAILLDKDRVGAGSTAASTGLLQYEVDTPLHELIGKVGQASAVRSYQLGLGAIDTIEQTLEELGDDCGFSRQPSLYLASSLADLPGLIAEYECRRTFGFDVQLLSAAEIASMSTFSAAGAIRSTGDAQINPLQFTQALIKAAEQRGLRVFRETQVRQIIPDELGVTLATDRARVTARRAVIATGYAAHQHLRQDIGTLHSTFAAASSPLACFDGWPDQCLLWETARPYFYLRTTPDGRAILGGEDTDCATDHQRDQLVAEKLHLLQKRFTTMFPRIPIELEYAWAGTFAETKDGLPYIGETPEFPHAYFALGYGGNGITFSVLAARIIADLFVRRQNENATIFRFDR